MRVSKNLEELVWVVVRPLRGALHQDRPCRALGRRLGEQGGTADGGRPLHFSTLGEVHLRQVRDSRDRSWGRRPMLP